MFNLAYPLEETVDINGVEYPLNTAFDNVLRLIDLQNDRSMTGQQQIEIGLQMLIGTDLEDIPIEQKEEILYQLFLSVVGDGEEPDVPRDIDGNPMPSSPQKKHYDYKQDAEIIYSSFMQCYGMDLFKMQGKLSWKKFQALLDGLSDDTMLKKVIDIRTCKVPTGKRTSEEAERINKLKRIYALKGDEEHAED